ncbi:CAP domain-containing protein [Halobacterium jilantaiense]|uniref:SCP domain-containing protein n=1 Tax=Halobacterium jilantaiense TaxID=355548 RepID=A0A1I0P9S0_9EURY|nr:CAP domain-containing protein [Halobacterium jilantaiense]SEW10337.1 hypothetical protein SAMN04487945_1466 [Halobacterium jilantaiense]
MAGRCTECGRYHHDGPPCENCGTMSFQPAEEVKACAECGAIHRDESPPCNECGAMGFRKVNPDSIDESGDDGDDGIPSPSQHSRRKVLYGLGIVGVLGAGGYVYLTSDDYPTMEAPGKADEASGIRFETVETEMRGLVNDERESQGLFTLSSAENVDAFAEYYNKMYVKQGGSNVRAVTSEEVDGKFNVSEYHAVSNHWETETSSRSIDGFDSASELARRTVDSWMSEARFRDPLLSTEFSEIGLDVHVGEDGDIFLLVVVD